MIAIKTVRKMMDKSDIIDTMQNEQEEKTCISIGILRSRLDNVCHYFLRKGYRKIVLLGKNRAADLFVKLIEKTTIKVECIDLIGKIQDNPDVVLISSEVNYDKLCKQVKEKVSAPVFLLDDIVTDICWTPYKLGNKGLKEYEEEQIHKVNLYDQREKQHLYKILSRDKYMGKQKIEKVLDKRALVIADLYYIANTDMCLQYLYNLPKTVDICVVTSNRNVYDYVNSEIGKNGWNNIIILQKMNQGRDKGRDISALLITVHDILPKYKYICLVHDRMGKFVAAKQDEDFWIENLWGNTIASKEYLANILDEFDNHPQLGLLVPPEPAGMYLNAWYKPSWESSFTTTEKLARELKLNCSLSINKPPVTLGAAFWCRYEALRKLFEKDWRHMNSSEEPLLYDGTTNQVVERILGFVAQDAGYKTSIVMNDEYAAKLFSLLQVNVQKIFESLCRMYHIENFYDVNYIYKILPKLLDIYDQYENIYLYGTGKVGMRFFTQLEYFRMLPRAFIETKCEDGKRIKNIPVYSIDNVELGNNDMVIISVGFELRDQIQRELERRKIVNYIFCQELQET